MTEPMALPFLKLIFHIFKSFGVASMKINSNFHFEASKIGIAYNVLLTILVLMSIYFGVIVCYFVDWAKRVQLEKIADTTHTLILSFTSLFILMIHCIRQNEIVNIANELRRAIEVSSGLCCKKTYEQKLHRLIGELKLIIFSNLITTSFWIISMPTEPVMIFLYFGGVAICNFIVSTLIMQYTIVMTLIAHFFDVLNTSLTEIAMSKAEDLEISFIQKFGLQTKLKKLSSCRDFFTSLIRLTRKISTFMDMIMLACIFNVFVTLIMYSYYTIKPFIIVDKNLIPITLMVHNFVQLAFSMVSMILLARAGSFAANQSKRTGEIVNECIQNEGFSCHPDIANQLNLFSNYLLHTNVRFGVCNLFTLDESLLMSIAGSITTYLVILLQFKQSNSAEQ